MSYRDDYSALLARCNALERELAAARREIATLRRDAGFPVIDEPVGPAGVDVEIREDDVRAARRMLEGLLEARGESAARGHPAPSTAEPEPPEPPARDAGTAELAVLRRAAVMLLGRRLGEVPASMVARIDACPTAAQLLEWIADIGAARNRKQIARILED